MRVLANNIGVGLALEEDDTTVLLSVVVVLPSELHRFLKEENMTDAAENSAVNRVAAVLRALASSDRKTEFSGAEVARLVGRERSQVSRMLKALEAVGFVEQNRETKAYRLGWQLFALTAHAGDQQLLSRGAPILRLLSQETGEASLLSVMQQNQSFTILRQASSHTIQAGGWVGRTTPLHLAASGRVLLFDFDDAALVGAVGADVEAQGGSGPLSTVDGVLERVHAERAAGVAIAIDELEVGLTSIGAPVRDGRNRVIAAVNISGPTTRMHGRIEQYGALAKAAARRLSHEMVSAVGSAD